MNLFQVTFVTEKEEETPETQTLQDALMFGMGPRKPPVTELFAAYSIPDVVEALKGDTRTVASIVQGASIRVILTDKEVVAA